MNVDPVSTFRQHHYTLLMLSIAGSMVVHVLMLTLLPAWFARRESPPRPLTVELLQQEPPELVPLQPLPMEARPTPETPKRVPPLVKQAAELRLAQEPMLTAPPEAPPSPAAPVVAEQRPASPVAQATDLSRTHLVPLTPPRSDAAYLNNPRPAYPLAARRRGDQGTVLIRVLVTAEGLAAAAGLEKTSGHSSLDEAALTAVKSWRFVPARQGAQAIESPYVVPIVFKLD